MGRQSAAGAKRTPRRPRPRSFSYEAKNEICKQPIDRYALGELAAVTMACGALSLTRNGLAVRFTSENLAVAHRIVSLLREAAGVEAQVRVSSSPLKTSIYTVHVPNGDRLLETLGMDTGPFARRDFPPRYLRGANAQAAVLRGAFLASGTLSNPRKNYHAEFVLNSESFAELLQGVLRRRHVRAKIIPRKEQFVLYLNEGDSIVALLALIGAHASILSLENVRILKETRNNVNRAVNCETANINKTVNAALQQIQSIETLEKTVGLHRLPEQLEQTARLRLAHPHATLQELCELGGTTKSCMNHRLRRLNAMAHELTEKETKR